METRMMGALGATSVLSLGGGGLGQLWGATTRAECVATVREAIDAGINLLDMAASYGDGEAEEVIGEAFSGSLLAGVRITTKCRIGQTPADQIEETIRSSLTDSLKRMRLDQVDLYFLHSNIVPDNDPMSDHPDAAVRLTPYSNFVKQVRPTLEALRVEGRIWHWGLTGIGHPDTILQVLGEISKPAVVQCICNPIDSAGSLTFTPGPRKPRQIMAKAKANSIGVMGIRAVQAGALCDEIDRPLPSEHAEVRDYNRAADYRALAKNFNVSAAHLGHRYALSVENADTIVLGIKNRSELADCLAAAEAGPLDADLIFQVENSFMD